MNNVIVTGSTGFLGSAVTRELIARGFHVFATRNRRPVNQVPGLTVLEGGIKGLTTDTLNRIRPVAIFHCARPVLPRFRRWGRMIAAWQANRLNSFLVSQVAASNDKPHLVFASGSLVYGNSALPHREDAKLNPVSYAREYHRGETPLLEATRNPQIKVTVLRFPWILGAGSWFAWFYLKQLKEKKLVPLFGDGSNLMSLISLTDAARLMVRVYTTGMDGGICNIPSPYVLSQGAFAELVASHYGGKVAGDIELFPDGVEKAVSEAFTSNILLMTKHDRLFEDFVFQSPGEVLMGIRNPENE